MTRFAGVCSFDSRGCDVAFDGRLDEPETADPAALALEAYRRHGAAGFRELIGDWSLALRDGEARVLVLASDYAGARPLYYRRVGNRWLWSSSLGELAAADPAPPLDDRYFARLLSVRPTLTLTPYRGVEAVPAGGAVLLGDGGARIERFWDIPSGDADRGGDYEERLRHLFRAAVGARVRGHRRVACELSGGLDSSSIACMAFELHPDVVAVSYTHPGAEDELYIRAVEERRAVESVKLDVREFPLMTRTVAGGPAPGWWEPRYRGVAGELASRGATALLTGQMGDLTMGNLSDDSEQVAEPLRRLRLGEASREAYRWSRSLRIPIYPILWRAARMAVSRWAPEGDLSPMAWQPAEREDSLSPRLTRAAEEPVAMPRLNWQAVCPDRRRRARGLVGWLESRKLETPSALREVEYSHPFSDRRLVEYMLAIPPSEVVRPGEPRRLMRRAFRELLPEAVLTRRSKASFGDFYDRCVTPLAQEMARDAGRLRTVELGYLERESLLDRLSRYLAGKACNADQLRLAILVEFWLRGVESSGTGSKLPQCGSFVACPRNSPAQRSTECGYR